MDHTVIITFDQRGNPVALSADGRRVEKKRKVEVDDTIRWVSPHGKVKVTFDENKSPFASGRTMIAAGKKLSVRETGNLPYHCAVITKIGKRTVSHGWPSSKSGGATVDSRPKRG
jgi:hypothetical protein